MKTMLCSLVGHSMIAIGTQAMAGIGRSTSRDRKQDLVHELEPAHHQAERNRDDRRQRKAEQDAAAAQHAHA